MDYKLGFARLQTCLEDQASEELAALATLRDRFWRNQRQERDFGVTSETKNEHAQIIYTLNELALEYCATGFDDLCGGAGEPTLTAVALRVPPPPDTFAGRTTELQKLTEMLLRNQAVAISAAVPGMGGVGKTTLALKLASDLAPHFPGGVVWLEVGYGAGQSDLVDRLARTLGIDLVNEPLVEKRAAILQSVLASRGRVFVILDDLWDIDLGRWAGKQLLPADRVLLVTGRDLELCRALCRHVQRLDVLPEPEAMHLLTNLLGELGQHEAAGREVAKLLDGHPLALEIAAGRCFNGASDLPWVLRRLRTGPTLGELKLPGQESRDTSVGMSLALSYGDLSPDLQQRFRALGVFAPAPFDLAGLAAVWKAASHDEAAEIARQLVRRALLAQEITSEGPTYRQHMLLRAYAWALLEQAGELDAVAAQHVTYYQALPGRQAEHWQVAEAFWEQIEQGWQHARRAGPAAALKFHDSVSVFLEHQARHVKYADWTSALLDLPADQLMARDRAVLLNCVGHAYSSLGENKWGSFEFYDLELAALMSYEEALPIYRQLEDKPGEATTLHNMGSVYSALEKELQALELYEQALIIRQQTGDIAGEAATLNSMALMYDELDDKPQAIEIYNQALPLIRQSGDKTAEVTILHNMGRIYSDLGEKPRAMEIYKQALPIAHRLGVKAVEAGILAAMGEVYVDLGEKLQGLELLEQARSLYHQLEDMNSEAATLGHIAMIHAETGDIETFESLIDRMVNLVDVYLDPEQEDD